MSLINGNNIYPIIEENNKQKVENLKLKESMIKEKYIHYKKLEKRWNIAKNACQVSGYILGSILETASIGLMLTGVGIPLALPLALGSVGIAELSVTPLVSYGIINSKRLKYHLLTTYIKTFLDKMSVFKDEIEKDGKLDDKEISMWENLIKEYDTNLKKVPKKLKKEEIEDIVKRLLEKQTGTSN